MARKFPGKSSRKLLNFRKANHSTKNFRNSRKIFSKIWVYLTRLSSFSTEIYANSQFPTQGYLVLLAAITVSWPSLESVYLHVDKFTAKFGKKAFYKNNAPWRTCLFCIGWLRNVQRFITRAEPLYDSLNPLFWDIFAADVVCARSLLLRSIKSHDVDLSVFCLLLY